MGLEQVRLTRWSDIAAEPRSRAKLGLGYVPQGREILVGEILRMGLATRPAGSEIPPELSSSSRC